LTKNDHGAFDAHKPSVDLDQLHAALGHYARMLWDIQKTRIGLSNRASAMKRDDLPTQWFGSDDWTPGDASDTLSEVEQRINSYLERLAKRHPMADWIAQQPGVGLPGFARLIGVTGSLNRFPTVSKLWKYLGLAVLNGERQRMPKGELASHTNCAAIGTHLRTCKKDCKRDHHPNCAPDGFGTAYSPQGLVVCHQLSESIIKSAGCTHGCTKVVDDDGAPNELGSECKRSHEHKFKCDPPRHPSVYVQVYDLRKAQYEAAGWGKSQAHRHNSAMRCAVKEFVKQLWIEWHRRLSSNLQPIGRIAA
jgi:hypothetical protein